MMSGAVVRFKIKFYACIENWLDRYDNQEVQLRRTKILDSLGLPLNDSNELYVDLCKYIHISKFSFDKKESSTKSLNSR